MNAPDDSPRRTYLLRYGHLDTGGATFACTDLPLSPWGRVQAQRLAGDLADTSATRIHTSDLCRALDTARIISADLGLEVVVEPALRAIEIGAWEGRPMAEVRREGPDAYHRRSQALTRSRPALGESFDDLACRVVPAFESIAAAGQSATLIVAHAGVNRVIIADLLGLPRSNVLRLIQNSRKAASFSDR